MKIKLLPRIILGGIVLIAIAFPTFRQILRPGFFPMHDDIQAMRLLEMGKCINDLQIPCRWVPDMGNGYGYPQFNYYGPFPYYLMAGIHLTGLGYLDSVKAGMILITLVGTVGMFLLGKSLWGTWGGIISAIIYTYAPYRALNFFVRGDVGELAALSIFPFLFWSVRQLLLGKKSSIIWLALSTAALLTSHNISSLIFFPLLGLWALFIIFTGRRQIGSYLRERIAHLAFGGVWGLMLGSFFILPAWFEKSYVHVETLLMGYFNYMAHFVSINQLLASSYWNYGSSQLGRWDEMYLGIGLILWAIPLVSLYLLYMLRKKKEFLQVFFLTAIGWIALFLTHERSIFIWKNAPLLEFLQFPWRFLIIGTFVFSLASGSLALLFKNKRQKAAVTLTVLVISVFLFLGYFHPSQWINITDQEKFSGSNLLKQEVTSIFDYLPIYAQHPPEKASPNIPVFIEGLGNIVAGGRKSNSQEWSLVVESQNAQVELPGFYFPGWKVYVDGRETTPDYSNELGLMRVALDSGEHNITVRLYNTPVRTAANIATMVGIILIPFYFVIKKRWKN